MAVIGVTIYSPKDGISAWRNGAQQNCFYLAALFQAAGHRAVLINGGVGPHPDPAGLPTQLRGVPFVRTHEVIDDLDVLIECGAQVSAAEVDRVRRSVRGGRRGYAITYKFGNSLAIDAERAIYDKPSGAIFNGAKFDEVWTTTQHEETCGDYWEIGYRCPLRIVPHIWESWFVDEVIDAMRYPRVPGYQEGREKKRVTILEPNINWLKTCHVPMLLAELAYRQRPELFDCILVANSEHMKKHLQFSSFACVLDICRNRTADGFPVCSFEARWSTPVFMADRADVTISHQWIDTPTYLHYDLLHLGYPLVHNISAMHEAGAGYYYPRFDAKVGAQQLIKAMTEHDSRREEYAQASTSFLETVRGTSPANMKAHTDGLASVMAAA